MKNFFTLSKPVIKKKKTNKISKYMLKMSLYCSDSCSNWLRIKQYLDILFLCGDYGICVHLFGFQGQNCLLVRNFKPVGRFHATKNEYDHNTLAKRYELYEFEFYVRVAKSLTVFASNDNNNITSRPRSNHGRSRHCDAVVNKLSQTHQDHLTISIIHCCTVTVILRQ